MAGSQDDIPPPPPPPSQTPTQQTPHTRCGMPSNLDLGGNDESKKMFQSLLSQLEIHDAGVSTEDANQKFFRSLTSAWSQVSLIMRTKPGVDSLSFDDLYNNLRVFENDVKGSTASFSTSTETIKNQFTHSKNSEVDKKGLGYGFATKACFVCGSLSHLIRDCDFHEKRMAKQVELNKQKGKGSSQREIRPVWNNVQSVNHKNQFVPTTVLTRTGKIPVSTARNSGTNTVNTARASGTNNVSTARHNFNSQAVLTNTARKISTVKPFVDRVRPKTIFHKTHSPFRRPFNNTTTLKTKFSKQKVNTGAENKGIVDSGCSSYMTGNNAYLAEYQDFNGGPVAFGGSKGYITSKDSTRKQRSSLSHLIKDCDYYEKKMAREAEFKKQRVFNTGNGVSKLVWTNANRVNHANQFVPRSVQVNTGRTNINSVRPNINTGRTNVNPVRPRVNTGSSNVNSVRSRKPEPTKTSNSFSPKRPQGNWGTAIKTSADYNWRNSNSNCDSGPTFIRTVNAKDHPLKNMIDRGIFDSGCSRHMTGNKDQLEDFEEFNGGSVTFRGSKGYIICVKGKLRSLHKVLFTETECLVVSSDFKMPDENQILLKVPRHHNMYSFDMKIPTPAKGFACLFAKATSDESKLWHISVLGKFDGKFDEGFFFGYSLNSKAYRVYNLVTKRVEVNLHVNFLEDKPNVKGVGYRWMFDIDYLTDSMNYIPVSLENQANPHAGASEVTNSAAPQNHLSASKSVNARRAADHNRKLNVVDHNQFVIRSLKSMNTKTPQAKHSVNHTKKVWKATRNHNVNTTKTAWRPTGKVVGSVKPQWKPTGRHFALYDNCPLTRIMEPIVEPLELTPSVSSSSKVTMISRFPDCKLSDRKAGSKGISGIFEC
ncbi:hypothetical protein Tco_0502777 [Tanacetum coccineum]